MACGIDDSRIGNKSTQPFKIQHSAPSVSQYVDVNIVQGCCVWFPVSVSVWMLVFESVSLTANLSVWVWLCLGVCVCLGVSGFWDLAEREWSNGESLSGCLPMWLHVSVVSLMYLSLSATAMSDHPLAFFLFLLQISVYIWNKVEMSTVMISRRFIYLPRDITRLVQRE